MDGRVLKVNKNKSIELKIFIFYMITVQYKAFWFLSFEDYLWHMNSITHQASLDRILEARSRFAWWATAIL